MPPSDRRPPATRTTISRRTVLRGLAGAGVAAAAPALLASCGDPPDVHWQPSVLRPVFYGHRDIAEGDGPPVDLRVFFPSLDGSPATAPIVRARQRFPLVLMLHGHCTEPQHYLHWFTLPVTLAMSGYVVAVPNLPGILGGTPPVTDAFPDIARVVALHEWLHDGWEHANRLEGADRTAFVGHSRGVSLGALVRQRLPTVAVVSLSGQWGDVVPLLDGLDVPALHMWGSGSDGDVSLREQFAHLAVPRHRVEFDGGGHWDYLPAGQVSCERERGACEGVERFAADLTAVFLGKYLPPRGSDVAGRLPVPDSLEPPEVDLTDQQRFFAGSHHLGGLRGLASGAGCRAEIAWATSDSTGVRTVG